MFDVNAILNNIQTWDSAYIADSNKNNVEKLQSKDESSNSEAVELDLSNSVTKDYNRVLSKEDLIVDKINSAQSIYDSLGAIRLEIAGLLKTLRDTEVTDTIEKIEELDKKSNELIDKTVNILKTQDTYGLVSSDYLSVCFEGFSSLKSLKLDEHNYFEKINSLLNKVSSSQTKYEGINLALYNEFIENSINYGKNDIKITDSVAVQGLIINNYSQALYNSASKLTPEIVHNLLQNK